MPDDTHVAVHSNLGSFDIAQISLCVLYVSPKRFYSATKYS
jgi:hypothetical protein